MIAALTRIPWLGEELEATLDDDGVWASPDDHLAGVLNERFSPNAGTYSSPAAGRYGWQAAQAAQNALGGTITLSGGQSHGVPEVIY